MEIDCYGMLLFIEGCAIVNKPHVPFNAARIGVRDLIDNRYKALDREHLSPAVSYSPQKWLIKNTVPVS